MIKCEKGLVVAEGSGKELLLDLVCILRTLAENDFPEEAVEIAVKMSKEEIFNALS